MYRFLLACLVLLAFTGSNYASDIELINSVVGFGGITPPNVSKASFALRLDKSKRVAVEIINTVTGKVIAANSLDLEGGVRYEVREEFSIEKQKLHIDVSIYNGDMKISSFNVDKDLSSNEHVFLFGPNFSGFNIPPSKDKYLVISNLFYYRVLKSENVVYVSTSAPKESDPSVTGTNSLTYGPGTSSKDVNDSLAIAVAFR